MNKLVPKKVAMKKKQIVFRKGKRVDLRPVLRSDIPLFMKWMNDPEVTQFLNSSMPKMESDEEEWLESVQKSTDQVVLVIVTKKGVPIGLMGIHEINPVSRTASTGAVIGEEQYRNRGLGSEAKMLLLDIAFNSLNLRKIWSSALSNNPRSIAYQKKCGGRIEGIRKRQYFKNGRSVDEILLAVFRKKWLPIWKKFKKTGKV